MEGGVVAWWSGVYRGNDVVQLLAGLGHILSILYGARFALAGDRAALRAERKPAAQRAALLAQIGNAHRPVLIGLGLALLTGLAQLLAQLSYLPRSPWAWLKLLGLVALLANGRVIQVAGARLRANAEQPRAWRTLRAAARRSLALWAVLVVLGLLLTTVRP
jgi:hypothetical protein